VAPALPLHVTEPSNCSGYLKSAPPMLHPKALRMPTDAFASTVESTVFDTSAGSLHSGEPGSLAWPQPAYPYNAPPKITEEKKMSALEALRNLSTRGAQGALSSSFDSALAKVSSPALWSSHRHDQIQVLGSNTVTGRHPTLISNAIGAGSAWCLAEQ